MGEETSHGVMEGRSAVAVEHVTTLMFSLHVRDRCLEGLTTVARQQCLPFVYIHFFVFFLSGVKYKETGISGTFWDFNPF